MSFGDYSSDGKGNYWKTIGTMEIDSPHTRTGKTTVCILSEEEAKAAISQEYGFEYNSIKIERSCWYVATDMNYFCFSVQNRWKYEVRDYGALQIIPYYN